MDDPQQAMVRVNIYGHEYSVRAAADRDYITEVAAYVDERPVPARQEGPGPEGRGPEGRGPVDVGPTAPGPELAPSIGAIRLSLMGGRWRIRNLFLRHLTARGTELARPVRP